VLESVSAVLGAVIVGRPSLGFVIVATVAMLALVIGMSAYLVIFRAYHRARREYRERRLAAFQPAIELVLMEEPYSAVLEALRPRLSGDGDIVQELITENMRHLQGPPFETLRRAAVELGFVRDNLRALRSWDRHRRGHAMERLGLLRSKEAVPGLVEALSQEDLDLKLVAMRALAAIGDPSALTRILQAAESLPPGLLPRLASVMLEFGAPGRDAVRELMNRRAGDFPSASVPLVLRELAQDWGAE
jgi:hypothetical protein